MHCELWLKVERVWKLAHGCQWTTDDVEKLSFGQSHTDFGASPQLTRHQPPGSVRNITQTTVFVTETRSHLTAVVSKPLPTQRQRPKIQCRPHLRRSSKLRASRSNLKVSPVHPFHLYAHVADLLPYRRPTDTVLQLQEHAATNSPEDWRY